MPVSRLHDLNSPFHRPIPDGDGNFSAKVLKLAHRRLRQALRFSSLSSGSLIGIYIQRRPLESPVRRCEMMNLGISIGTCEAFTGTYGVNYGRISDNIPAPEVVVSLLKAVKIKNVKIFDSDHGVLNAFKGSGLELVVGLSNDYVKEVSASEDKAMEWIKENVQAWLPDTHIRGIAVGNEVLGGADQELEAALFGAIKNVYKALSLLKLTDLIQISSPHSQAVFDNSYPPSNCTFRENIFQYMKPILDFFSKIDSPFSINIYPFIAYKDDPQHIDLNYALFEPNRGIDDPTTNLHYDNMFDAVIDAAYAALEAAGYDKTVVEVTETGWASSGDEDETGASNQYARTYNYNLRKRLFKRKGTPRRPKIVIKAYIFALFNEDLKPGPGSERHYGLFKPDGSISYDIGLSTWHASSSSCSIKLTKPVELLIWIDGAVKFRIVYVYISSTDLGGVTTRDFLGFCEGEEEEEDEAERNPRSTLARPSDWDQ
ncbi:Glucan endo-1,3-beta-glucosidase 14 [Platanthera zijinensis]|uniref:glucan endo-1,3-beta-D-glucosidase n=1 Tax=Platanthera zijinensis TaxID=2320716 RepID=A0AAP0BT61_9ASPA